MTLCGWRHETGFSPPVKYFTDRSKGYLFCVSFVFFCLMFVMLLRLFIAALWSPAGKGQAFWLSFAMFNCVFANSYVVSWVGCGT